MSEKEYHDRRRALEAAGAPQSEYDALNAEYRHDYRIEKGIHAKSITFAVEFHNDDPRYADLVRRAIELHRAFVDEGINHGIEEVTASVGMYFPSERRYNPVLANRGGAIRIGRPDE